MQCNCNIVNILQLITIIKQYLSYNYDYDFKVIYECLISCLINITQDIHRYRKIGGKCFRISTFGPVG